MKNILSYPVIFAVFLMVSCVPQRKLEEEKAKKESCEKELNALKASSQNCETERAELTNKIKDIEKQIAGLKKDTSIIGTNLRNLTMKYDKLNQVNEQLLDKYNRLLTGNVEETKKLSGALQGTQEELIRKQDELKSLEQELNKKKQAIDQMSTELKQRSERVAELENILKKKEEAVTQLKKKVQEALLGFENKGLTITQKNGKVYVSLEESLLFATGSTKVEAKGAEALKHLGRVLEQNSDINVLVEGHTDDVPMKGSGEIKDNWDLSVMRATSIVKILLKNGNIDPKRLTAAGKGEFFPVDPAKTADARRKNRRTEIILTPKLDELLKILETN